MTLFAALALLLVVTCLAAGVWCSVTGRRREPRPFDWATDGGVGTQPHHCRVVEDAS